MKKIIFIIIFILFIYLYVNNLAKKEEFVNNKNIEKENIKDNNSQIINDDNKIVSTNDKEKITTKILQSNFDFQTDSSMTKYVSNKIHFNKLDYHPKDLVSIEGKYIIDTKGIQLSRIEAKEKLDLLAENFYKKFQIKLKIVSAFRDYEYQKGIKDRGCPDNLCAKAGYSEHQTGLAFDFFEASTKDEFLAKYQEYYDWLDENAYKYGFHNSYKNGVEIDGYDVEPWHWRYLGEDLAKKLYEKNITFAEFFLNFINP